jgi:uncharacterized protein YjbI with pentapeptide repeats
MNVTLWAVLRSRLAQRSSGVVNSSGGLKVAIRPLLTRLPDRASALITRSHTRALQLFLVTMMATAVTVWLMASTETPPWLDFLGVVAVGVLLVVGCLFAFPYARVWNGDEALAEEERKAANDIRSMLIGLIGAVLALSTLYFTYQTAKEAQASAARSAQQQLAADRRGLLRDQFNQGAELVDSQSAEVRMAGMSVLGELAREDDPIRRQTLTLLTAYIRAHATWTPDRKKAWTSMSPVEQAAAEASQTFGIGSLRHRAQDVQAALGALSESPKLRLPDGKPFRADLQDMDLQGALLGHAKLQAAKFAGAHLDYADARTTDDFANLEGADFQGATLYGAHLDRIKLAHTTFRTPLKPDGTLRTSQKTDLRRAHFVGTDLTGADFTAAVLRGAELRKAKLVGARLTEADLRGARLEGADLTGADLTLAKLDRVSYDRTTKWPAGFWAPPDQTRIQE